MRKKIPETADQVDLLTPFQIQDRLVGLNKAIEAYPSRKDTQYYTGNLALIDRYIETNLPDILHEVPPEHTQGVYSPSHSMRYCFMLVELGMNENKSDRKREMDVALNQGTKLLMNPHERKTSKPPKLAHLDEIPDDWRNSDDGCFVSGTLEEYIKRRKNREPISEEDMKHINDIISRFHDSCPDIDSGKRVANAKDLFLVHMSLLGITSRKNIGNTMPPDVFNINLLKTTRGVFHYNKDAEKKGLQNRTKFIPSPKELHT